jgi:hypothetical protein
LIIRVPFPVNTLSSARVLVTGAGARHSAAWMHFLDAAAAGGNFDDLKLLAAAAWEKWRSQQPDDDGDQESLGKKRGKEDTRTVAQRFHDALLEGCELLIQSKMVPDRAGADSRVEGVVALSQLRDLPGAPVLEEAWLAARAGEHGYLAGKDAEVIACDALIVPVVVSTARGPAAATSARPSATCTTSGTRRTAATPASASAFFFVNIIMTSAFTGGAGKSNSCPAVKSSLAGPADRFSAATAHPPPKPPDPVPAPPATGLVTAW